MLLFAWLLQRGQSRQPSARVFVLLSLLGSMAFSVPATLLLLFRHQQSE
jgi:hypothetical protein